MAKPESLYLTEAQIAERVGIPLDEWESAAIVLERDGLPTKEPLFKNRRYWPACRAFLDNRYNLGTHSAAQAIPARDGEERWNMNSTTREKRLA